MKRDLGRVSPTSRREHLGRTLRHPVRAATLLAALGAALATGACGSSSPATSSTSQAASSTPHPGGTLRLVRSDIPGPIDTATQFGTWDLEILTHDGLMAFKRVSGQAGANVVPDLATATPKPQDGGKTWTFALQPGIRYSNGRPLQARDFRTVFERQFTTTGPVADAFYGDIVGAKACESHPSHCDLSQGVQTDDAARTVTFHLTAPDPNFLDEMAAPFAFAVPAGTSPKPSKGLPAAGTGPYMWQSYNPSTGGVLVRNPYFHVWSTDAQPAGNPDRIDLKIGLPLETEVTEIENGQADAMYPFDAVPTDRLNEISTRYPSQVHSYPLDQVTYFFLNVRVPPFNNLDARRAINYAVDRGAFVKVAGGPALATPTCQFQPPGLPGYRAYCPYTTNPGDGRWHGPDLAKARQLVKASGTAGTKVTVIGGTDEHSKALALQFVSDLKAIGYRATTKLITNGLNTNYQDDSSNKAQTGVNTYLIALPTADDLLRIAFSCKTFLPNSTANENQSEYCSPSMQTQMDASKEVGITNLAAFNAFWGKIDRQATDLGLTVPLYNGRELEFLGSRVHGFGWNPVWTIYLDQLWLG